MRGLAAAVLLAVAALAGGCEREYWVGRADLDRAALRHDATIPARRVDGGQAVRLRTATLSLPVVPDSASAQEIVVRPHNSTRRAAWWGMGVGAVVGVVGIVGPMAALARPCTGDENCFAPQFIAMFTLAPIGVSTFLSGMVMAATSGRAAEARNDEATEYPPGTIWRRPE